MSRRAEHFGSALGQRSGSGGQRPGSLPTGQPSNAFLHRRHGSHQNRAAAGQRGNAVTSPARQNGRQPTCRTLTPKVKARYFLTVEACDGGADPRRSRLTLSVTVLDVDDNSPVFGQRTYKVDLPENSPEGTVILRLRVSGAPTWFTLAAIPRRTSRGKSSEEACPSVRHSVTRSASRPGDRRRSGLQPHLSHPKRRLRRGDPRALSRGPHHGRVVHAQSCGL